ncbi:hypothetical protein Lser_V15G00391 [Lactuca serriola]
MMTIWDIQNLLFAGNRSGASRALVKYRLKSFNGQFEELHQRQSQWTVPETKLRESIRLAVVEVFYMALVENGKNPIKYIRYSAEDLDRMLCEFFKGDGVSESQFNQVLNIELDQIIKANKFLDEKWKPKFLVIIAQKNHHTKFFQQGFPDNFQPDRIGPMNSEIKQQKVVKHKKHARLTKKARPEESMSMVAESFQNNEHVHLLSPIYVSASLSVNRSGRLENNAAQYSVDIELSGLVLSLDEDQLQQILYLYDYLCTCQLREKYGRYRPWGIPIS